MAMQMVEDGDRLRWIHLQAYLHSTESFISYIGKIGGRSLDQIEYLNRERWLDNKKKDSSGTPVGSDLIIDQHEDSM